MRLPYPPSFYRNAAAYWCAVLVRDHGELPDSCLGQIIDNAGCHEPDRASLHSREMNDLFDRVCLDV